MYICICIYMLAHVTCVYIYIYLHLHAYTHSLLHTYAHATTHADIHIHSYMHTYTTWIHTCIYIYMHACIHTALHTCIHTSCASIHACTHTHTFMRAHIWRFSPPSSRQWLSRFLTQIPSPYSYCHVFSALRIVTCCRPFILSRISHGKKSVPYSKGVFPRNEKENCLLKKHSLFKKSVTYSLSTNMPYPKPSA